ncbi:hypothetical protein CBR_g21173 [Chara braunii]|uniref:DUF8206 domain-containing protein n=1 Tax=Chara braunii TaxID=69332 RepID=A0A388L0X3_CHABU|nr:hypothetical protein CBR_g21173 [Chara braunii]|eukprot:GBG75931.1 hypothetical protein CBR_g21173 [Chara braunii]
MGMMDSNRPGGEQCDTGSSVGGFRSRSGKVVIERSALGRRASLGDLYDICTDSFCQENGRNITVLSKSADVLTTACPSVRTSYTFDDSLSARFQTLGVSSPLKMSILGGLLTPEGAGRFLVERDPIGSTTAGGRRGCAKATLFCQVIASELNLDLSSACAQRMSEEIASILAVSPNATGMATHFVSRIVLGATLVVSVTVNPAGANAAELRMDVLQEKLSQCLTAIQASLDLSASTDRTKTTGKGRQLGVAEDLQDNDSCADGGAFITYPTIGVVQQEDGRAGGEAEKEEEEEEKVEEEKGEEIVFTVRMFADFVPREGTGGASQTLRDLEEVLREVLQIRDKNRRLAVPVIIYLSPLAEVLLSPPCGWVGKYSCYGPSAAATGVSRDSPLLPLHPDKDTVALTEELFQELHDLQAAVEVLPSEMEKARRCHSEAAVAKSDDIECVQNLGRILSTSVEALMQEVGNLTIRIRRSQGDQDSSDIRTTLDSIRGRLGLRRLRDLVAEQQRRLKCKVSFVEYLKANGIGFIAHVGDKGSVLQKISTRHKEDSTYVLVHHHEAPDGELWRKNVEMLKHLVVDSGGGGQARTGEGSSGMVTNAPFFYYVELQRAHSHDMLLSELSLQGSISPLLTEMETGRMASIKEESWAHERFRGGVALPAEEGHIPRTEIRFYMRGKLVHEDLAELMDTITRLCLVRCSSQAESSVEEVSISKGGPIKGTTPLKIKCPGAMHGKCCSDKQVWHCNKCYEEVEYDWDGHVCCNCGRYSLQSLSYLCRDSNHHGGYLSYGETDDLTKELNNLPMRQEINILLLGETGVGKSTFINAFANYLTFDEMEHVKDDVVALIPSQFTVYNMDSYTPTIVSIGKRDSNEDASPGQSSTQSCQAYRFNHGQYEIRLIDTPGIGDTRGIETDKKNFDNILRFVSYHKQIHGICILLKPNNARLNIMFRFCINELLSHLHKSAKDSMVFMFTNSRSTNYRPGDTMLPLQEMLNKIRHSPPYVDIPLSKDTIYCLDSEAFRFLAAVKQGVKFTDEEKSDFAKSWTKSSQESRRLMDRLLTLPPHIVQHTVSINEARRLIDNLLEPLTDISKAILANKKAIVEKRREDVSSTNLEELKSKLYVPTVNVKYIKLPHPAMVCTGSTCRETVTVNGIHSYHYKNRCCSPCHAKGWWFFPPEMEKVNLHTVWWCQTMGWNGKCRNCRCDWSLHMYIMHETRLVHEEQRDDHVQSQIKTIEDAQIEYQRCIWQMEEEEKTLDEEQQVIRTALARFCVFLKRNAITMYNDSTVEYLDHLIKQEQDLQAEGRSNPEIREGLLKLKQDHIEQVRLLSDAQSDIGMSDNPATAAISTALITPEDIQSNVQHLFALKICGSKIKGAMEAFEDLRARQFSYSEVVVKKPLQSAPLKERMWGWFSAPIRAVGQVVIDSIHGSAQQPRKHNRGA